MNMHLLRKLKGLVHKLEKFIEESQKADFSCWQKATVAEI